MKILGLRIWPSLILTLSILISLSSFIGILMGGLAYVESDSSIVYTNNLQSSGSNDSMVLYLAVIAFGSFSLMVAFMPDRYTVLKYVIFVLLWLITIPFFYTEVASYSQTIHPAHNWGVAAFLVFFISAPVVLVIAFVRRLFAA